MSVSVYVSLNVFAVFAHKEKSCNRVSCRILYGGEAGI